MKKKRTEDRITKLAEAAIRQAVHKVIARAIEAGTPVIVSIKSEVKAVDPRTIRIPDKPTTDVRRVGRFTARSKAGRAVEAAVLASARWAGS
jgi:hypothetical protein